MFEMVICISAAPLIHASPNALQTGINKASQQPCEVGGCEHPTAVGTMRALGIKGLAAVLLGFDPELGHLRPSASDQALPEHRSGSTWGYAD